MLSVSVYRSVGGWRQMLRTVSSKSYMWHLACIRTAQPTMRGVSRQTPFVIFRSR